MNEIASVNTRLVLLFLGAAFLLAAVDARAEVPPSPIVSSSPTMGNEDARLRELWRAGLDDDLIFGRIRRVVERDDGGLYVLDSQLNEIQVFSSDGQWESSIGREGEAPGEFRNPTDLFLLHDGNLAVVQMMPPKVALLQPDGVALDDHRLPDPNEGVRMLSQGLDRGGELVLTATGMFFAQGKMESQTRIFAIDREGHTLATYFDDRHALNLASGEFQETDMTGVSGVWTLTSKGRVVVAEEWGAYRLRVYAPDGTLVHVVERPFTAHVRTAEERERASATYSMNINGQELEVQVSDVDRVIDRVYPRSQGGFQVLIREKMPDDPPGLFARLDEFDAQGHWVRELRLLGDVDLDHDQIFLGVHRIYVVRNAIDSEDAEDGADERIDVEEEPLHLVCFSLER